MNINKINSLAPLSVLFIAKIKLIIVMPLSPEISDENYIPLTSQIVQAKRESGDVCVR
jgi:hypothetical protein